MEDLVSEMMNVDLKGLNTEETEAWAAREGLETYRGRQIRLWLFKKFAASAGEMTDLPKSVRTLLDQKGALSHLETVAIERSADGTRKFLFGLVDGLRIESVLIPERDHYTLCVSSQVGCAMGCRFCLTAKQGFKRNLKASEIVDQAVQVKRSMEDPDRLTNIVFMGMGEPLANYDSVIRAVNNLTAEDGMNFSHRKVTLSTCGLVPELRRLGRDAILNLAVSLNAADDRTRSYLMPVNRRYNLEELLGACREFPLPNRRRITFEYILIRGVNDRDEDARNLVRMLSDVKAKINLIPLNTHPDLEMSAPPEERILRFQDILVRKNFTAVIRKSKGRDISAACGQLSGKYEKYLAG